MSCGVGHREGLDPALLWLWCRLATGALNWPPAGEISCAMGEAQKRQKKKKRKEPEWNLHPDLLPVSQGKVLPNQGLTLL